MTRQDEQRLGGAPIEHGQAGYEKTDADAGATFRAGLYILAVMFLVAVVLVPLYRLFARAEREAQPERATVIQETPAASAFPKLVVDEPLALAELRAQEDRLLASYGWVEKDRGIARMPVSEAMRAVAERGALPVFPSPAPAPGGPAGGAR